MRVSHVTGTVRMMPVLDSSTLAEHPITDTSLPHSPDALIDDALPFDVSSVLAASPFACTRTPTSS